MKFIKFSIAFILIISIAATANAQKWERAYTKDDVTFNAGYGMLSRDAFYISSVNNYSDLQGDYKPANFGPLYLGFDVHSKDNYIIGVSYSYVSAQSGANVDDNFMLYQHKYSAHQLMVKYSLGWFNSASFGGMFYSGVQIGAKLAKGETDYFDAVFVSNPVKYPYKISSVGTHLTIIGLKGRLLKNSALGFDTQVGFGDMGIYSIGLNYTIR
jgi:hypothetical protein